MTELLTSDDWRRAVELLRAAERIVVFTGAGISAESGIETFRDADGFWNRFPPERFARWQGLIQTALLEPKLLAEFLLAILEPIAVAEPNPGHRAVSELEQHAEVVVVTQNIDGLHQAAGSCLVHEVHGTLFDVVSMTAGSPVQSLTREDLAAIVADIRRSREQGWTGLKLMRAIQPLFGMDAAGMHRPNLVLFGDAMAEPAWSRALDAAGNCDVLLSVGTSQSVYPAALLPETARAGGAAVIVVDPLTSGGDIWLPIRAGEGLPRLVAAARADAGPG